jgi:hypothetical protein
MIAHAVFTPQSQQSYPHRQSEGQQSQGAVIGSGDRALERKACDSRPWRAVSFAPRVIALQKPHAPDPVAAPCAMLCISPLRLRQALKIRSHNRGRDTHY